MSLTNFRRKLATIDSEISTKSSYVFLLIYRAALVFTRKLSILGCVELQLLDFLRAITYDDSLLALASFPER